MNIFKSKTSETEKYAGAYRRTTSAAIDVWIVLLLRIFAIQALGMIWLNEQLIKFMHEFTEKFGTETIKNTPEHIDFILHHSIFIQALIFYFLVIMVGAIYHAYLNSSAWQGTVGKRIMKIMITTENGLKITFKRAILHYFLSILPFAFLIYLVSYQTTSGLTFYQSIMSSEFNIFLGIIFVMWVQIHSLTKKRTTAYDLICNTILTNGRTDKKWPWSK